MMYPKLESTINAFKGQKLSIERRAVLQPLIDVIQSDYQSGVTSHINFICTHNSRRSQIAQMWAQTLADYFEIPIQSYSGGVEVTAFNERAVAALQRAGFRIVEKGSSDNPIYFLYPTQDGRPITAFSKKYDDEYNKCSSFIAVITCDHADQHCPVILEASHRIPVKYTDPKISDGTALEASTYSERVMEIGAEMLYVFEAIDK